MASNPTAQPVRTRTKPKRKIRWGRVAIALVIVAAAVWGGVRLFGGGPSFSVTVVDKVAVTPSTLSVTLKITNTGSSSAAPTCIVSAHDSTYQYQGTNSGSTDPIKAGATITTAMPITISSNGADQITDVTAHCN